MANKKSARVIISCILLLSLTILNGCSFLGISDLTGISAQFDSFPDGLYINGNKTEIIKPERESAAFKNLSEDEKKIYCSAYTAVYGMNNEFAIKNVDYDHYLAVYSTAMTAFIKDFPEFFWLNGYVEANAEFMAGESVGNVMISLGIYDYWRENDIGQAAALLDEEVNRIVNAAKSYLTDFERVKYVHDTIILNVKYDTASYELGDEISNEADAKINTPYGALIDGKAVCGGYAGAFMLVMRKLGYNCEFITGIADGGPHAWNMIELGNEYYHIDLTWDDADGTPCEIVYSYFCVNDDEISKNHISYVELDSLSSTATEYNYHIYNEFYLEKYSFEAVKSMANSYDGKGLFTIKCAGSDVLEQTIDNLISDNKIFDINAFSALSSYQYMVDDELLVLSFIFN